MKSLIKIKTELDYKKLKIENAALKTRLAEAEDTLDAIRKGEVDALVVKGNEGDKIYTLEGSDYLYRLLVETMNEGAATVTHDHYIIYCNKQLARILNLPAREITGKLLDDFIKDEDRMLFSSIIEKGLCEKVRGEVRILQKDKTVPVLISCNPLDFEVPGVSMIVTDLTELKKIQDELKNTNEKLEDLVVQRTKNLSAEIEEHRKTEEKLQESTAALQSFYDGSSFMMGVAEINENGIKIVHGNSSFAKLLGVNADEVKGMTGKDLANSEEELRLWSEAFSRCKKEGIPVRFEYQRHTPNGKRWLSATTSYLGDNLEGKSLYSFICEDITERKFVEEKLKSSEENLQNIIKYAPTGIYEIDYKTPKFRSVNEAMCHILGYTKEEIIRLNPFDILDEESRVLFGQRMMKVIAGEDIDDLVEYKVKRKNGSTIWALLNIKLLYKDNKIDGALVVAHDITERKNMEEQLRKKNQELIKINEVLEDFVYITAHDLRAPVANMKMLNEYLKITKDVNKKVMLLNNLTPFINSLERTIDGMVETIHVQKADTTLCKKLCISTLFDVVKDELKEDIKKYQAEIRTEFVTDEIIYVDTYLISVLHNLLSNALKYSDKDKKPVIEVFSKKNGEYILLKVRDNGIGIDLENEANDMFKPFKRFTAQAEGTGMGLYIVKNIIEKNGGYIDVESEPGQGTTFFCYLKEYEM